MVEASAQLTQVAARRRGLAISERRLLLAAMDVVAVAGSFVVAFNLHTAQVRHAGIYVPRLGTLIAVAAWIACGHMTGVNDLRTAVNGRATVRVVLTTVAFSVAVLLAVFFVVPYQITRPTILLWAPLACALVLGDRFVYRRVFAATYFAGRLALVIGSATLNDIWPEVRPQIGGLYRVATVIDPHRTDCAKRLRTLVDERGVDQIVLGVRDDISRDLFRSLLACHDAGVRVRSLADLYEEITGRLLLDQLGHTWLMSLPMRSETSRLYASFKRVLDIAAGAAATALLAVLLLPLWLAVRFDDHGKLFHVQSRVGQYGRSFNIAKLRTMREEPGETLQWTEAGDRRITRVGQVLRKLHLDELPQGWAILKGNMSLIGPRPEQPHYVDELRQGIDFYNTRLTVRPGLTGWAQVNHGYASGVDGARVKLSYDLFYIKHQSVSLDVLIIARTILAVLSLDGR